MCYPYTHAYPYAYALPLVGTVLANSDTYAYTGLSLVDALLSDTNAISDTYTHSYTSALPLVGRVPSYPNPNPHPDADSNAHTSTLPVVDAMLADTNAISDSYSTSAGLSLVAALLSDTYAISYSDAISHPYTNLPLVGIAMSTKPECQLKPQ